MTTHYLDIDKHQLIALAFNEDKPGIPIIFLHGVTQSIHFWAPHLPEFFTQHIRWYSLSLPGHYPATLQPTSSPDVMTPEHLAQVLDTAIAQLVGNQPVSLVGYSTGGFMALNLAALRPKRVKHLLCIASFAKGQWNGAFGLLQKLSRKGTMGALLFKTILKILTINKPFYRFASGLFMAGDRQAYFTAPILNPTIAALYPDLRKQKLDTMLNYFNHMAHLNITALLPKIKAPTTILHGDRDSIIAYSHAKQMTKLIPNAELKTLTGMGHMFFAERTKAYHRILMHWVEQTILQPTS
jgi:pimeloyl-ACP methyl ester carboxylesterase